MIKYEHYTDNFIYHMEQTTAYFKEKGEQCLKNMNAGLTLDQFIAVDILSINPGICQMDLAKVILKDRVYTSRLINALEEKGLAERRLETKGKRPVNKLYLTKEGEKLLSELQEELQEVCEEVFKDFDSKELEATINGILKLKECISKYTVMPL